MHLLDRRIAIHFDFASMVLISIIIFISGYLISEISSVLFGKFLIYNGISIAVFLTLFLLPIRKMLWLIPILYWLNILCILAVEFFGVSKLGARRWLNLPLGFTYQPSETMKAALILMLAYTINKNPPKPNEKYSMKEFVKIAFYIILPFILILKQPDLGTAVLLLLIGAIILFLLDTNWKIWAFITVMILAISPIMYSNLKDYQKKRITDFLSADNTYQVKQSIIAIGSGGIIGKQKDKATQTQMKFLPIASSDFIFSYVGERFGFIGICLLFFIYMLLILHLFLMFFKQTLDYLIKIVALGYSLMLFIYMSINVAMTIGLSPVVGLPLPLISYGGTSFISFITIFAILQNLLAFRFNIMYTDTGRIKQKSYR